MYKPDIFKTTFYTVGGTVQAGGGIYIPRKADTELLEFCREGEFAYVLTTRQMGKSSLMVHIAEQLNREGVRSIIIDLTQIGVQVSAEQWYLGLITTIADSLGLGTDPLNWWVDHYGLGTTQRLTRFFQKELLSEVPGKVVVFIDEIDTTISLPFSDDFYASIRYLYNARVQVPELRRLSFVMLGVATPSDLIKDPSRTPFNIGRRVDLTDFTPYEALPLAEGLGLPSAEAKQCLSWILKWTNGHPYLTQRVCRAIADLEQRDWSKSDTDRVVFDTFLSETGKKDSNLTFVGDMLTKRAPSPAKVLSTYRNIYLEERAVPDEAQSQVKTHLKLSGVVRSEDGFLLVRNLIYRRVFNEQWIKEHLPVNTKPMIILLIVGLLLTVETLLARLFRDSIPIPENYQLILSGLAVLITMVGVFGLYKLTR